MGHSQNNSGCGLYKPGNDSDPFHLGNTYGGIPTNLITNGIGWICLMTLFIFIRQSAFRFLKLESLGDLLLNNTERNINKLVQVFFRPRGEGIVNEAFENSGVQTINEETVTDGSASDFSRLDSMEDSIIRHPSLYEEGDRFWSWLTKAVFLPDSRMLQVAGPDAVQYLRFQKYLISFVCLTTLLCICIILPFNFQGELQGNEIDFGHTTLANLDPESKSLYVHIGIAFILFPISIIFMRRFSVALNFRDAAQEITRTIQVENIPRHLCKEELLERHFIEAYPNANVKDIKLAYDVSKLTDLTTELKDVLDARIYGENYKESHEGKELDMLPVCASRCCFCWCACCVDKVQVVEFYTEEESRLKREVERHKELSLHCPLGMAFVTFSSLNESKHVHDDHISPSMICGSNPSLSSLSTSLRPDQWRVSFAPPPKDIYWENLSDKRKWLITKTIIANMFVFIVALFLTTPEYIVSQLDSIILAIFKDTEVVNIWQIPSFIKDFLPTLMLWTFTALLPVIVAYSDRLLGHWYRSEENHSIMIKSFWYLWIMVVIFPTFGFTTGMALITNLFHPTANSTEPAIRWDCIFLPDSGAFFVNYVITTALIGSGLELIRFPELFWYGLQVCFSRSEAESRAIQRAVVYEFRFGEQYARMLLIFSMVIMYSISCPLITPFGLIYFILKHLVDKHNLAFVYAPSKINKKVHRSAINFVIFSVTLLQVFMVIFSFIRSYSGTISDLSIRTKISLLLFILTLIIFCAQIWSDLCKKLSPIKYVDVLYNDDEMEEDQDLEYIPDVLKSFFPKRKSEVKTETVTVDVLEDLDDNTDNNDIASNYGTFVEDLVDVEGVDIKESSDK